MGLVMSSPAFQFYPADFLVGTADMSAEEVGGYMRLLCYQWTKGGLPNDDGKLSMMAGCDRNAMASIRHKFGIGVDGKLRNERMEQVRAEQDAYRARQAENASKRWKKNGSAMPPQCDGNATAYAVGVPEGMPNACPSPSPSSSIQPPNPQGGVEEVSLPEEVDTPELRQAWIDYTQYRKERRLAKLQPSSIRRQFEQFRQWGVESSVACIDLTIRKGWQGIVEPKSLGPRDIPKPNGIPGTKGNPFL